MEYRLSLLPHTLHLVVKYIPLAFKLSVVSSIGQSKRHLNISPLVILFRTISTSILVISFRPSTSLATIYVDFTQNCPSESRIHINLSFVLLLHNSIFNIILPASRFWHHHRWSQPLKFGYSNPYYS